MKKLIALALCLCLTLCLLAGCGGGSEVEPYDTEAADDVGTAPAEQAEVTPDPSVPTEETETVPSIGQGGTGYETYPSDTVVATVNGTDVTWMEYFYWLRYYTVYIQQLASQYGLTLTSWDDHDLSQDNTNADVVIMNAKQNVIQDHVVLTKAKELGIDLTADDEAKLQSVFEQNADSIGDQDGTATEEEIAAFEQYLAESMYVDRDFFDTFNTVSLLSEELFRSEYGESGADYSDEDALTFADDNGLMAAKHILLMTVDPETREPLSTDEIDEKLATAKDILEKLQAAYPQAGASAGPDELATFETLFDGYTANYTEDTGYANYPDGYVFGEGEMVEAFENAVKELDPNYGLSEIVESDYGYHIILRIPVDPDAVIGTTSGGEDITLRYAAATQQFNSQLAAWVDAAEVVWSEGFEEPDLAAIFG